MIHIKMRHWCDHPHRIGGQFFLKGPLTFSTCINKSLARKFWRTNFSFNIIVYQSNKKSKLINWKACLLPTSICSISIYLHSSEIIDLFSKKCSFELHQNLPYNPYITNIWTLIIQNYLCQFLKDFNGIFHQIQTSYIWRV